MTLGVIRQMYRHKKR